MKVILTAMDEPMALAWTAHCGDIEDVIVKHGSILDVECDAVVSPANSFGFMDGGVDLAYRERFGSGVQERLQAAIRERRRGELLVGAAEIVETGDAAIPYLVAAPTMRVPMIVRESVNPYLAARAALYLVLHETLPTGPNAGHPVADHVTTIGFPGLGTGVGGISPSVCATQVAAALTECLGPGRPFPDTWHEAQTKHQLMYSDRPRDLQFESRDKPSIVTQRLVLEPLLPGDAETFHEIRSAPEVYRYHSWVPGTLDETARFIDGLQAVTFDSPGTWFQLAIRSRESGELVGDAGIRFPEDDTHQVEIGFTIAPGHQRQGFATEAVTELLGYLLGPIGKHRVSASVDPRNGPSLALLNRIGLRQEAHFRQSLRIRDEWVDDVVFGILSSEWNDGRERERFLPDERDQ